MADKDAPNRKLLIPGSTLVQLASAPMEAREIRMVGRRVRIGDGVNPQGIEFATGAEVDEAVQNVLQTSGALSDAVRVLGQVADEIGNDSGVVVYENGGFAVARRSEFKGPTGAANSTYTTLAELKAAPITNASYIFAPTSGNESGIPAATFYYRGGDFNSRPDGPGFIKLTGVTTGALFAARDTAIVPNLDATKDIAIALQAAIDAAVPGDEIRLPRATYRATKAPVVKPGIRLNLNGSFLGLYLSGALDRGVTPRSNCHIFNGAIHVFSTGQPSLQAGVHAPITIGPLYGDSPSKNDISPEEDVSGCRIYGLTLSTDKLVSENGAYAVGGVACQIYGGVSDIVIDDIYIPDSDRMFGGIHADWAFVGPIDSANVPASRAAFDAGDAYTTHPKHIRITRIRGGKLSRPIPPGVIDGGSHGVRASGVRDFFVEDVRFQATTYATVMHTAGDLGFEFARDDDRRNAHLNLTFRVISCADTGPNGALGLFDTLADNVYRATLLQGYQALLQLPAPTNMKVVSVTGRASGAVTANAIGIYALQIRGGTFEDCSATGYYHDHKIGDLAFDVRFVRPRYYLTRMDGIYIGEPTQNPPVGCSVEDPRGSLSNRAGMGRAGVFVGRSVDTVVAGGVICAAENETAKFGIQFDSFVNGCKNATIRGNPTILGHASGGAAISVSSDEGYGALRAFEGSATYGVGVTTQWAGLTIVPVSVEYGKRRSKAPSTKLSGYATPPAGYPGVAGEVIEFTNPVVTGDTPPVYLAKTTCYTAGTPGTWRAST